MAYSAYTHMNIINIYIYIIYISMHCENLSIKAKIPLVCNAKVNDECKCDNKLKT